MLFQDKQYIAFLSFTTKMLYSIKLHMNRTLNPF